MIEKLGLQLYTIRDFMTTEEDIKRRTRIWCWNIFVFPLLFLISMVGSVIHAYQQKSFCSYLLIILNLILLPTWWYISTTVFRAF